VGQKIIHSYLLVRTCKCIENDNLSVRNVYSSFTESLQLRRITVVVYRIDISLPIIPLPVFLPIKPF